MKVRAVTIILTAFAGVIPSAQVPSPHPLEVPNFNAVTEEMLRNPAPGDWPNWRRTDNAWGYSPLTAITTTNVRNLKLAWSWAMTDGANEATAVHLRPTLAGLDQCHAFDQIIARERE